MTTMRIEISERDVLGYGFEMDGDNNSFLLSTQTKILLGKAF